MKILHLFPQQKMQLILITLFFLLVSAGANAQEGKCVSEHIMVPAYSGDFPGSFLSYGIGKSPNNPSYRIDYVINTDNNKLSKVVVTKMGTQDQEKYFLNQVTQITSPVKYTCHGDTYEIKSGYIFWQSNIRMMVYYNTPERIIAFYIPPGPQQFKTK